MLVGEGAVDGAGQKAERGHGVQAASEVGHLPRVLEIRRHRWANLQIIRASHETQVISTVTKKDTYKTHLPRPVQEEQPHLPIEGGVGDANCACARFARPPRCSDIKLRSLHIRKCTHAVRRQKRGLTCRVKAGLATRIVRVRASLGLLDAFECQRQTQVTETKGHRHTPCCARRAASPGAQRRGWRRESCVVVPRPASGSRRNYLMYSKANASSIHCHRNKHRHNRPDPSP